MTTFRNMVNFHHTNNTTLQNSLRAIEARQKNRSGLDHTQLEGQTTKQTIMEFKELQEIIDKVMDLPLHTQDEKSFTGDYWKVEFKVNFSSVRGCNMPVQVVLQVVYKHTRTAQWGAIGVKDSQMIVECFHRLQNKFDDKEYHDRKAIEAEGKKLFKELG